MCMKIEDAIKQTKAFNSVYQKAGVNLMYTNSWYTAKLKSFFKKFGLTVKQYNILRILKGAGKPVSTSFIRERLLDKMSDVSRIIDRMFDKNLVIKEVCSNDKRLVDIGLTKIGEQKLMEVDAEADIMDKMFKTLSSEEAEMLNALLDKLRNNH